MKKKDIEHTSKRCKAEVGIERLRMALSKSNPNVRKDSRFLMRIED
jgi:hypothetical protein